MAGRALIVFVGKIDLSFPDFLISKILEKCGTVTHWRRVSDGVTGVSKPFGYCHYATCEGILRCVRLLNDFQLGSQKLVVCFFVTKI
jgi:RNA recognition motif-containing protein